MQRKIFWIKWYLATWLSSDTRLSVDVATRGVYRDLIDLCYLNGGIPSDRDSLIRMACCTAEEFDAAWPKIRHKFVEMPDRPGRLTTDMVEEVLAECGYDRDQKSAAGKLGVEAKRRKREHEAPAEAPAEAPGQASQSQSHILDSETSKTDLDCPLANRKERGSQADAVVGRPIPSQKVYPHLREALRRYMGKAPSDRTVVDILHAARGATEADVVACLAYLGNERGLRPGTKNGPETWSWFKTTIMDHFAQERVRDEIANPCGYAEWQERNEAKEERELMGRGIDALELPDA